MDWVLLALLGTVVGIVGTLLGAGGGFLLVPILLVVYPREKPEIIACMSLAVVFFNALSGSVAYARMRRIDYLGAAIFSIAAMPLAVIGAMTTRTLSRQSFDLLLGTLLFCSAVYLFARPGSASSDMTVRGGQVRRRTGGQYFIGAIISVGVGFVSSLLGIGGGIIHVPAMVHLMKYPVHVATATSHLTLAAVALAGTVAHITSGEFSHGYRRTIFLALGVLVGAQVGAMLSNRVHGMWIMRGLAAAMGLVGLRVLLQGVSG